MLHRFIQAAAPLLPGSPPTLVAVSGGADSMALLHLLAESRLLPPGQLTIAHFNHGLRPDSGQDAAFVAAAARNLNLKFLSEEWQNHSDDGNLSANARSARYDFFKRAAEKMDATHIATGHHLNDQAETFLERLLRGSAASGLAAMRRQRPLDRYTLIRPLLSFTRGEIEAWLREKNLAWRDDPGNRNLDRRRNRIRLETLPHLETVGDPGVAQRLAATAGRMAQADDALEWTLDRLWPELESGPPAPAAVHLGHAALAALPEELQIRALLRCHRRLIPGAPPPGSRGIDQFIKLLRSSRAEWRMKIRGLELSRDIDRVTITRPDPAAMSKTGP